MDVNELDRRHAAAPLVILPGLLCDSRMFQAQITAFGAQVIDGFYGDADRIDTMVDYVLQRMPSRVSLLGHSMGARVAIELYRRAPDRIERLALANTGVHDVRAAEPAARHALRDIGRLSGSAALVDAWLPPMVGPSGRGDENLMTALRAMAIAAGIAVYERQIAALLDRPDARSVLPTIACPTMVIAARHDNWAPVAQHEAFVPEIRGAQLRVITDAGHMAPAEAPDAFNTCVHEWLSEPVTQISELYNQRVMR